MASAGYHDNNDVEGSLAVVNFIPPQYRGVFKFTHFNHMQSSVLRTVLGTDENIVIGAPTGSGKTVIHELAIIKLLIDNEPTKRPLKCMYVAPNKALCQQHHHAWTDAFGPLKQVLVFLRVYRCTS
jgi:ATP-dependent DNA helicase HFM1/MER3